MVCGPGHDTGAIPSSNGAHGHPAPATTLVRSQLAQGGYRGEPIHELYCDEVQVSCGGCRAPCLLGVVACCTRRRFSRVVGDDGAPLPALNLPHPCTACTLPPRTSRKRSCCWACAWYPTPMGSFSAGTPARPSHAASGSGGGLGGWVKRWPLLGSECTECGHGGGLDGASARRFTALSAQPQCHPVSVLCVTPRLLACLILQPGLRT